MHVGGMFSSKGSRTQENKEQGRNAMAEKNKKKDGRVGHTDELCPWIHIDESACGYSCVSTNKRETERKRKGERETKHDKKESRGKILYQGWSQLQNGMQVCRVRMKCMIDG